MYVFKVMSFSSLAVFVVYIFMVMSCRCLTVSVVWHYSHMTAVRHASEAIDIVHPAK